jgi:pyocin large subunit-like protein
MRRLKLRYFFVIFLCIFALSCSQRDTSSPSTPESNSNYVVNVRADNFAPGQLEAHYLKHGYQFGNITQSQYLENARELLNAPTGNDLLEKIRSNGDVLHYMVSTGEFAVMARDGRIRTYFKTDYKYWLRQ